MTRVLFVNPFSLSDSRLERQWATPFPPLGLLYLAASARQSGHEVSLLDGTFAGANIDLAQCLADFQPDAVCFSTLITWRSKIPQLARLAKKAGAKTLAGGPDASQSPDKYLDWVDAVVVGEGDLALLDWLAGTNKEPIPGLMSHASENTVHQDRSRTFIADLDSLPSPAYDLVDLEPYFAIWRQHHGYTSLALAASRGCPFGCQHCAESSAGPHFRVRSPVLVAAEMLALEERYHPDRFRLVDDLEGLGREWLKALGQAMIKLGLETPYEGLRPFNSLGQLPMLVRGVDVCHDRNLWIPKDGEHAHAPPSLEEDAILARWRDGALPEGEHLEDP